MKKGSIELIMIMIIGAVSVSVACSLLLLATTSIRTAFAFEKFHGARALADACAENALQEIWGTIGYSGTGTLALDPGECAYTITDDGEENRTITSAGTVDTVIRKVKITIDRIIPDIHVTSWQEVADF